MSRGRAVVIVAATFLAGGAAGWVLRGGAPTNTGTRPPLTVLDGVRPVDARAGGPSSAPGTATASGRIEIKSKPTPGHYVRLGPNETLSEIAQRAYGTTRRAKDLLEANPHLDPRRVPAGTLVYVPLGSEDVPPAPPPLPPSQLPPMAPARSRVAAPDRPASGQPTPAASKGTSPTPAPK